jgi:sterol desaturase/sphingolipid hydroxylase (fatty acid hydroxylase superfamily)
VLQVSLAATLVRQLDPTLVGTVSLSPTAAFLLAFVGVDYLFYWNHRLLHGPLWPAHQVHHSMTDRDVLGTSRNTLWTSLLICYLWVHALALVTLADPTYYLTGVALTSALDLWRHSSLDPPWAVTRLLDPWLVLPKDHAWHHEAHVPRANFGANLKIWDRIHGTYLPSEAPPDILGRPVGMGLTRQLLFPFGSEEEASAT